MNRYLLLELVILADECAFHSVLCWPKTYINGMQWHSPGDPPDPKTQVGLIRWLKRWKFHRKSQGVGVTTTGIAKVPSCQRNQPSSTGEFSPRRLLVGSINFSMTWPFTKPPFFFWAYLQRSPWPLAGFGWKVLYPGSRRGFPNHFEHGGYFLLDDEFIHY